MAGLPPLFGFVAKEKAIDTYLEYGDFTGATATLVVIVVGSILTFAYSARFVLGVFGVSRRCRTSRYGAGPHRHRRRCS